MLEHRLIAWLRHVPLLAAAAGLLTLAGCGGGNGAPNNQFAPQPSAPPPVIILPAVANIYSGVPTTLTITSGTPPFTAFSSNAAVLPVASSVGTTIALLANQVAQDEQVSITIQDGFGQRGSAALTVKPSLLLPTSITVTGNPNCGSGTASTLCSGQDGAASVKVTGPAGSPLPGRQVRYDVVQGDFALVSTNPGSPSVQTLTVVTDQNGTAGVTLRVPSTAVTQFGTLRATDVTSGSSVVAQFSIVQIINGNAVLSVIPQGKTTFTGPDKLTCSSGGLASFYIFGGTPPYTVGTNFPTAISLIGTPVLSAGGSFSIVTNGSCFTGLTFAISDTTGRVLVTAPLVDNVVGAADPAPSALSVLPTSVGPITCVNGSTFNFVATGGAATYTAAITNPQGGNPAVTVSGNIVRVSFVAAPSPQTFSLTISSGSSVFTAPITCN